MNVTDDSKYDLDTDKMNAKELTAMEYLKKHKINELFENLTASLIYTRPDNPREYLLERVEQLRDARTVQHQCPSIFDESNITSLYRTLDVTNRGYITMEQYREAIQLFGIKDYNSTPTGAQLNRIALDTFVREIKLGLQKSSATFAFQ